MLNKQFRTSFGLMPGQRRGRWPGIKPKLDLRGTFQDGRPDGIAADCRAMIRRLGNKS